VEGNDPGDLRRLLGHVTAQQTRGNTDIYGCAVGALDRLANANLEGYAPAIILMTDGESNEGSFDDLEDRMAQGPPGVIPVYGILFGDASEDQLDDITAATSGRVFDGQSDLIGAMRSAKENN